MIAEAGTQDAAVWTFLVGSASALATILVFVAREFLERKRRRTTAARGLVLYGELVCSALRQERQEPLPFEMRTVVEFCTTIMESVEARSVLVALERYRVRLESSRDVQFEMDERTREQLWGELDEAVKRLRKVFRVDKNGHAVGPKEALRGV